MSNSVALRYDRFVSCNADNNKDISMTLSVYVGSLCMNIFKSGLNRPVRLQFPRSGCVLLKDALQSALNGQPGQKVEMDIKKFNRDSRRSEKAGSIVIGLDEESMIYIGVIEPTIPPSKFIIRASSDMEVSSSITDSEKSILGARTLIEQLSTDIPMAMMLTSLKNQPSSKLYEGANKSRANSVVSSCGVSPPW